MNRAERRRMMRKIPGYKKVLKNAAEDAVNNLEAMLKKNWDDESLNDGEIDYDENGWED